MELALNLAKREIDTSKTYDVLILGGGTAALGAALYTARYELSTIMIAQSIGGAIIDAPLVENYLGLDKTPGVELVNKFRAHVENYGAIIAEGRTAVSIERKQDLFRVKTDTGEEFRGRAVIIATGTRRRKLGLPKEEELTGRGISYCTTCDAPFFKDKVVGVVGGGDSAITGAVQLADVAKKVYVFVRSKIRAEPINMDALKPYIENGRVEIIMPVTVQELLGNEKLEGVRLSNGQELRLDGLFIEIGGVPNTDFLKDLGVELDNVGHIIVDKEMRSSMPGIFAAGDVIDHPLKQCITAAAEGAVAAYSAYQYIKGMK